MTRRKTKGMVVDRKFVDVSVPGWIIGIIHYREYSEKDGWGEGRKSLERPFKSIRKAREWIAVFEIGEWE